MSGQLRRAGESNSEYSYKKMVMDVLREEETGTSHIMSYQNTCSRFVLEPYIYLGIIKKYNNGLYHTILYREIQ